MRRHKRHTLLCAAALLLTGCGREQSSLGSSVQDLAETTESTTASDQTTQTTASAATETTAADTTASGSTTSRPPQTDVQTVPQSTEPAVPRDETVTVNGVIVAHSGTDHPRAIESFYGNTAVGTLFAQSVNEWKARLGGSVHVWCMAAPSSQAFYQPEDLAPTGDQRAQWENISAQLVGVTPVPLYYTLGLHTEEPIYSRTDYHWFPRGAYYAASVFASLAELPFPPLSSYTEVTREGYLGAFFRVNKVEELQNAPEQFTYYKPDNLAQVQCTYYDTAYQNPKSGPLLHESLPVNSSYQIFGGRDDTIFEVTTNAGTGRTLVIFKDSFGNALTPFLTHSFDKIVVCDFRYFEPDPIAFIQNEGATDLLFCMTTTNIMSRKKTENLTDMLRDE